MTEDMPGTSQQTALTAIFGKPIKNAAVRQSVITCFLLKIRIHHRKPQIHPGLENPETVKPAHTAGIRHASATV